VLFSQELCVHMLPASQAVLERDLIVQATPLSLKQQCNNSGAVQHLRPLLGGDTGTADEGPWKAFCHGGQEVKCYAQSGHVRRPSLHKTRLEMCFTSMFLL